MVNEINIYITHLLHPYGVRINNIDKSPIKKKKKIKKEKVQEHLYYRIYVDLVFRTILKDKQNTNMQFLMTFLENPLRSR